VSVSGTNYCENATNGRKEVTVTVNPAVASAVDITAQPDFIICEDDAAAIVFTAVPTNGGSTPSYVWKLNGSPVGNSTGSYTADANLLRRKSIISCTLTPSIACPVPATASKEKEVHVSSCVIPVNPHIRGRIK
jgi:hypothetical protein